MFVNIRSRLAMLFPVVIISHPRKDLVTAIRWYIMASSPSFTIVQASSCTLPLEIIRVPSLSTITNDDPLPKTLATMTSILPFSDASAIIDLRQQIISEPRSHVQSAKRPALNPTSQRKRPLPPLIRPRRWAMDDVILGVPDCFWIKGDIIHLSCSSTVCYLHLYFTCFAHFYALACCLPSAPWATTSARGVVNRASGQQRYS